MFRTYLLLALVSSQVAHAEERILADFRIPSNSNNWRSVNDGVMGGRSSGRSELRDGENMAFLGNLSLENNGGFASVRAYVAGLNLKSSESIVLKVKGDGRTYNFNIYTQANLGGYSYRQSFNTKRDEWIEVELPVSGFSATWRGRKFPNQKFDPAQAKGMGILLGDKKAGPFSLEIEWIKAVNSTN